MSIGAILRSEPPRRPVLFQSNSNQLAARADSCLYKKLLEGRLHRRLGDIQVDRDLLVTFSRKDSFEYIAFALTQLILARLAALGLDGLNQALNAVAIHPRFAPPDS